MKIFTIGYAGKTAEQFFTVLKSMQIKTLIDVRLYNTSQLAGYTKKNDLNYFTNEIAKANYLHLPAMSPTKAILDAYKKGQMSWQEYQCQFDQIITERQIENIIPVKQLDMVCLLCAEKAADKCHRRLVGEYLANKFGDIELIHL